MIMRMSWDGDLRYSSLGNKGKRLQLYTLGGFLLDIAFSLRGSQRAGLIDLYLLIMCRVLQQVSAGHRETQGSSPIVEHSLELLYSC